MNWQLMNQTTLQDSQSGFIIRLIDGTWFHPKDVQPLSPPGIDFLLQARLLRLGLFYIETLQSNRLAS